MLEDRDYMKASSGRGRGRRKPVLASEDQWNVLKLIIAINIGVYLLQVLNYDPRRGIDAVTAWGALSKDGIAHGRIWQFVTHMFLHGNGLHIILNMVVIYFVGRNVMLILGQRRFLILYMTGGIVGGIVQLLIDGSHPLVGASGAAYALILAFTTILWNQRVVLLLFFIIPIVARAKNIGVGILAAGLILMLLDVAGYTHTNIGHWAHFGGALVGYIFARRLGYGRELPHQRVPLMQDFEQRMQRRMTEAPSFPLRRRGASPIVDAEVVREEKSEVPKPPRNARKKSKDQKRVDAILDKIYASGINSLSPEERRILEESGKGR